MNRQEMKSISYEVYKAERERREELEVVAAALYLGHDDAKEQMEMYREVYILQPHGADGTCETGDCGPKPVVKHDPHCDCGICPYCNGLEDVFGRETNPAPQAYREKAIDRICDDFEEHPSKVLCKALYDAGAADREAEKWVPVSERLPTEYGWYLVTVQDTNDLGTFNFTDILSFGHSSELGSRWWDDATGTAYSGVVAWKERPEPYAPTTTPTNVETEGKQD
jgi:hypothetical protein